MRDLSFIVLAVFVGTGCATASNDADGGTDTPPRTDAKPPRIDAATVDAAPGTPDARPMIDAGAPPDASPATCTADTTLSCGELAQHTLFLANSSMANYSCETVPTTGTDNIYTFTSPSNATVTLNLDVIDDDPLFGDDLDIYVLSPTCSNSACIAQAATAGDDQLMFNATAGTTYFVIVETFATGLFTFLDYDLQVTCN